MKVYLDNNVVCAIAKDDTPQESAALDRLLEAYDLGTVDLVTSELTLTEIKAYHGSSRPALERTFRLLEKVPIVRWDELLGIHSYGDERTWIDAPVIQNDPDYDKHSNLALKPSMPSTSLLRPKISATLFLPATGGFCSAALPLERYITA